MRDQELLFILQESSSTVVADSRSSFSDSLFQTEKSGYTILCLFYPYFSRTKMSHLFYILSSDNIMFFIYSLTEEYSLSFLSNKVDPDVQK